MLKTFKKILCSLLVVVMCLTSVPLQGFVGIKWPGLPEINFGELFVNKATAKEVASSGSCGNNVTYTYNSSTGELIISGTGAMKNYSGSTSPFYDSDIKSVIIEEGVTTIGNYAFWKCADLTSVTIPSGMISIGSDAFYECESIKNISLPNTVEIIESYAFSRCHNLEEISIPNSVQTIERYAFEQCFKLKTFVFPEGVTYIGEYLFLYCYDLASVTIPKSITKIYTSAFSRCNSLTDIYYLGSEGDWNTINIIEDNNVIDNATIHFAEASHVHTVETVLIPATCAENGMQYDICTFCGEILSDITTLPASHTPGAWEVVSEATDQSEGKEIVKCKVCKEILEERTIPKKPIVNDNMPVTGQCGDNVFWSLSGTGELIITGEGPMYDYGYKESPFYCNNYNDDITSIVIGDEVTTIGNAVFYWCFNLETVTIGKSIKTIGYNSFNNCDELTSITIPDSVVSIGDGAFYGCSGLRELTMPVSTKIYSSRIYLNRYAFWGCYYIEKITLTKGTGTMCDYVTDDWSNDTTTYYGHTPWYISRDHLKTVIIEDGVKNIGKYAFYECNRISDITIPDSVTSIGYSAFYNCTSLTNIIIPNGVKSVSGSVFYNCTSLTNIIIPNSVTTIGDSAFYNCINLANIIIPDSVEVIGNSAFYNCRSFTSVIIPNSVTSISDYAFYTCTGLKNLEIPVSTDAYYSYGAFLGCTNIETIVLTKGTGFMRNYNIHSYHETPWFMSNNIKTIILENGIKNIGDYAFYNCTSLIDIVIPNSVSSIGEYAFYNCASLTNITLPDSITSIGEGMFYSCKNLKSITIPNSVETIYDSAFYYCEGLEELKIPVSAKIFNSSSTFYNCRNLETVILTKGTGTMVEYSVSSYKYTPWYHSRENDLSITIKSGVKNISAYAFKECTGLKNITIPYSVNHIGDEAFFGCKELEDMYIPRTVKSIGNSAFKSCTKLIDIKIPYGVVDIGEQAFRNCSNIENITISNSVKSIGRETFNGCSKIRTIKLPNNLSSIEPYTFYNCSELVDVTIPKSVTSIGNYAFYSCKNLTDVYYSGSEQEWKKISMGSNTGLSDVTIHYAIDDLDDELSNDVIISTNLKFDKESYEASYSSVLNEGSHEEIKLTFTADINTINTFDKDDICFSILDESIATFDRSMYIKSVSSKENATIYCKLNLHKSGTTIVNAILPDGSTATCTLIVKDDDDWRKDKVKIEFRYADSKEIIDTSHKYQSDEQIKLNFTTERSGQYISSALNGILYLDSIYFPLTSISATWKSKYGEKEYAIKSNETLNAQAGDTIVVYMSEIVNNGSVVNKHTNGINDNYGVSKKEDSFEKEFRKKAKNFVSLLDEYIALINGSNSSKKKEPTKEMLEKSATELKNSSIVDRIYAIPPKAKFEYALCYALASAFFDKTMENIDLGKIDLDKSKEEIAYNLTKKLISNFDEIETTVVYENYKIYIKLSIVGKAFTGYYHAYNNKNGSLIYGPGLINSNKETTEGTLNAFFMSMADIVRDMLKAAMMSIFKELADVTGLTEFRKELLNETVKNALSFLEKKGFGKVIDILMAGREIYINIKDIASASSDSIVSNLLKNEKSIRNLYDIIFNNSFTSQKAKDEAAKVIISKLESARKEIYNMLYNKLYGIESDEAGIVTKAENWIKANILCPVDVEVYNIYGELIAYIDTLGRHEEHIYYTDDIYIEVQGDEKFIYYPANKFVEFKFYATENGEMTYSLERIENGESINRINYYNVPLVLGCEYTQDIPSNSDFVEMVDQLYLNGDINIYPDELLDGEDETAHIRVMYSATVGGTVSGDIYYPKGDCVTLFAYPEDGYIFNGWYINEKCVSKSEIYRFAAIEDVIIVAKFDKYEKTDIEVDNEVPNLDCIVISEDNLFLDVGQQEVIYYLPIPSKAKTSIQWLSDNSTVATIDENGLVTACSKGETIITAIDIYTGIKVQCKVFVECEDICLLYGHDFSDWYIDKTDTCIVNGIEKRYCLICNYVEIQDIPSIGHKLSEWYEVTPATCEKAGLEQRDCSECDYSETQEIPATGHDFDGSECKNCDYDKADDCSCKCHKSGIAKFFFKIGLFFQKIFKKNKVCKCGVYHY